MKVVTLASGSNANSTYVESGNVRLLFDMGLSGKATFKSLNELGILPMSLSGIFITHEHKDHCRGLSVFTRKYNVPVYVNEPTAEYLAAQLPPDVKFSIFSVQEEIKFDGLMVVPFSVPHNSIEPLGYSIIAEKKKVGILTDCGFATNLVKERLKDVDLLLIESNYDEELLKKSSYPWAIKQRISGRLGHLSNKESASLIAELFEGRKAKVILGHLSENTNTPELVAKAVKAALRNNVNEAHEIYYAPRNGLGAIFNL